MPNYTENLQLVKPLQSEQYNIDVFNANADKIDQFAGQVPSRALTADKLTTGAKINGVNFKGDTDIVTGAGFYYDTVTYGAGDLAFIYNSIGNLELHKSLQNLNIGHNPLTSTGYWEKQDLGGSGGRNVGEIIQSSLPLTDAGLHLLDGTRLSGDGIYKEFVDYVADLYNDTKVYNPSAFTVVGSPTITDDGIASGFSGSDYLKHSITTTGNSVKIKIRIKTSTLDDNIHYVLSGIAGDLPSDAPAMKLLISNTNKLWLVGYTSSGAYTNVGNYIINADTEYLIEAEYTSSKITYKVNNIDVATISGSYKLPKSFLLGNNYNSNECFTGSIDLKQFSITVDGKEVFSGSKPAKYFTDETTWQSSVTTYGSCGKFVYDSVNNTVRLPKITGILEGTTDVSALGDLIEAGLPNITGSCGNFRGGGNKASGALYCTSTASVGGSTGGTGYNANIDASRSNSIYGNSNTVQPQTIKVLYYIVVATTTKTDIEVDIDNIATDLNGKADTDLTNITDTAKIMMAHNAMPSNTYVNLTLGASDTVYTAPADGWFSIDKVAGADWYTIYLQTLDEKNNVLLSQAIVGYRTTELKGCLPVRKGQKFKMWYNASGTTNYFRFIYAVGSESEAQ